MIYFTSDTHYFHKNVIEFCKRPYKNLEDMHNGLITNWNSVVRPNDTIYHLGDFSFGRNDETIEVIKKLNGYKILIMGNHDRRLQKTVLAQFDRVDNFLEITWEHQKIVLLHYAMKVWNRSHHGSWQLYGHSHGSLPDDPHANQIDVGVDCWNYTPISFDQVKLAMKLKQYRPVDAHGRRPFDIKYS